MAALRRNPNGYHVCCDIKGFYDNVDHQILIEQIRRLVPDKYIYRFIERAVRSYEFKENGRKGLPQGPAYARILANLYLNDLDSLAVRITPDYFRYVDDIVLAFKDKEDAERGLEHLAKHLLELGLEFSQDEAKKPTIEVNTDVSRVRRTLDKIQYGILDGRRNLPHLAPKAVEDFGDAVERHKASPVNLEQLIQMNDLLPTLLYVVTHESLFPHPLKSKVRAIVGFLIRHRWFCPKNLKNIFYNILKLETDRGALRELFEAMEPAYKAYFILSVFGRWKTHREYPELLQDLAALALAEPDSFVWGFAVAIASYLAIEIDNAGQLKHLREALSHEGGVFGLVKWVGTVSYGSLGPEERKLITQLVGPSSPDLIKMLVLSKLSNLPTNYIDGLFVRRILQDSGILLLPAVSALVAAATDGSDLFYRLIEFGLRHLAFKALFLSFVTKQIFSKRAAAGLAEMDNLKLLYGQISDEELAKAMVCTLSRITNYGLSCDIEFAKLHKQIDHYNECFLFESTAPSSSYAYLELIPENRLREYIHRDLDSTREIIGDFSANKVLLPSTFFYSSKAGEVRLEFKNQEQYAEIDPEEFSRQPDAIRRALVLAAQAYNKAAYFHRKTGKAPPISLDNVLVDVKKETLVFRTVGRSLCMPHWIAGLSVGDELPDIAKMVSVFLRDLLFEHEADAAKFLEQTHHKGLDAFFCQCIQNMGGKEQARRYSCSRFAYLVAQFTEHANLSEQQICILYLRERLKAALFRFNSDKVTWGGICRAVNEHVTEHLRVVCGPQVLQDAPFRNRLLFASRGKHELHTLSRELLNLVLNRQNLLRADCAEDPYFDLVEFMLLYGIICVETVSLARVLDDRQALRSFFAGTPRTEEVIHVEAGGLYADFASTDLGALLIGEPNEKMDQAIRGLSLPQLAIQSLLACGVVEVADHSLKVEKPRKMSDDVFHHFAHACLIRLPKIEKSAQELLNSVFSTLRSNEDFARPGCLREISDAVEVLAEDLQRFRRCLTIVRRHGRASCGYFPPDISCKSVFRRTTKAKEEALSGIPLANQFPTNRDGYACSWDARADSVANLVIPSEGVNSLMVDLSRGRIFGYKFRYLYSGKALLLWDIAGFVVSSIFLATCGLAMGSTTLGGMAKGFSVVGACLFGSLTCFFAGKAVMYDLEYWMGSRKRFMRALREMFTPSVPPS
jgi:hypothetical protein